jgi:hypothetical protein
VRDKSEWEKKPSEGWALTLWRDRRMDKSEWEKKPSERRALTSWRAQTEGQVRIGKETERVTGTHELESAEGGTKSEWEKKLSE